MPIGMGAADITDRDVKAGRDRLIGAASDPLAAHLLRRAGRSGAPRRLAAGPAWVYDFTLGDLQPPGLPAGKAWCARWGSRESLSRSDEGGFPMALYMYQAAYTPESMAAQIKNPHDRIEAVRPALEAMGIKFLAAGYPFGEYDVLVVYEAPDDTTAASVAMAVAAGGAVKSAKTTRLLTGQEWVESLRKAQGSQYQPAR